MSSTLFGIQSQFSYGENYVNIGSNWSSTVDWGDHESRVFEALERVVAEARKFGLEGKVDLLLLFDTVPRGSLLNSSIFITTEMLPFIKSDDNLAGLLGHEIAHRVLKHRQKNVKLLLGCQVLGCVIFSPVFERLILHPAMRENEFKADELGFRLMRDAGYNPQGYIEFLEEYGRHQTEDKATLSTHPLTSERVKRLKYLFSP